MRTSVLRLVMGFAMVFAALPPAAVVAQSSDGAIAGVVKDSTGAALPGVTLTVSSLDRGIVASTTVTGGDGATPWWRCPRAPTS